MLITRPPLRRTRRFLRDSKCPDEIDADDALEFVQRHFLDGAIADNPGIVYEDVEPAALILDLFHHRFDLQRLRHVALDHQRLFQFLCYTQSIGFVLSLRVSDIIHHALCAAGAESLNHLRTNSPRAARNQRNFPGEIERIFHDDWRICREYRRTINAHGNPINEI